LLRFTIIRRFSDLPQNVPLIYHMLLLLASSYFVLL